MAPAAMQHQSCRMSHLSLYSKTFRGFLESCKNLEVFLTFVTKSQKLQIHENSNTF